MVQNTGFSRPTIERAVKKLKELNLIVRIGGDKGGHWEIIEQSNKYRNSNVTKNVGLNVVYFRITKADIQSCRIVVLGTAS